MVQESAKAEEEREAREKKDPPPTRDEFLLNVGGEVGLVS
jgi:hypothetical protein